MYLLYTGRKADSKLPTETVTSVIYEDNADSNRTPCQATMVTIFEGISEVKQIVKKGIVACWLSRMLVLGNGHAASAQFRYFDIRQHDWFID